MLPSTVANNPTYRSIAVGLITGLVAALPAALFRTWTTGAFLGFIVLALLLGGLLGWCQQLLAPKSDPERDRLTAALRSLASGSMVRLEGDTAEVKDLNALCDRIDRLNRALEGITANALPLVDRIELSVHELSQSENEPTLALPALGQSIDRVSSKSQALSTSIEEMSMSMEEMLASITEVSSNTNTLSLSVGQTSTGIEEMATSIQHVAANVVEANRVAENASEAALAGQRSVHQTIEGMEQINRVMGDMMAVITHLGQSSNEIGNIVEVIEDIADQTNLLALNAAIEAARAGEVGRGFAVVADEVRKLAERSAKATKEIAGIIKGIQSQIAQATTLTSQGDEAIHTGLSVSQGANSSLEAIVQAVDKVRELIIEIAHAAEEQAQASQIISTAVSSGAVMSMGSLTQRMVEASGRQSRGAEQIIMAIDTVYGLTQEILTTAAEQRTHSEQLLQSLSGNESHPAAEALAAYALELKRLLSELGIAPELLASSSQRAMVPALSLPAPSGR